MRNTPPPSWNIHPFVRLTPAFLIGVIGGETRAANFAFAWCTALTSLLLMLCWLLLPPARRWAWKLLTGAAMYLLLVSTGAACSLLRHMQMLGKVSRIAPEGKGLVVELREVVAIRQDRYRARAIPIAALRSNKDVEDDGLLLYIDLHNQGRIPESGDLDVIRAAWKPISNRGNPGEPDFAAMQAKKGIYWQAYVTLDDLLVLEHRGPPFWEDHFLRSRLWIEHTLHRSLSDSASADLASTLLTGHRAALDPDLLRAYADTGVVHVIAISGLHLGMIHGLILWLLNPLFRRLGWSGTGALVVLPWLWIYAFFTGGSASVIRSAVMFTGIGVAGAMGRRQYLLNGLGSSAMVLLAWRPEWIADIGCQLSYAALLSIALFQPYFRDMIKVINPLGSAIRDLVTVTLAAQVLTAPLVAYHFHRLPLLFLFSNLLVVPLSSLVLLLCILLCACPWLTALTKPLGSLTTVLIHLMNGHVLGMDAVPNASLTDLHLSVVQVIFLYGMIALLASWRRFGKRTNWMAMGALCLAFQINGLTSEAAHDRQRAVIVFNCRQQGLYALVEGHDMLALSYASPGADTLARNQCLLQAAAFFRCRPPVMIRLRPGTTTRWKTVDRSWSIQCGPGWTRFEEMQLGGSFLVLSGTLEALPEMPAPTGPNAFLVADASMPLWKIPSWKSSFDGIPSRFHSVTGQGAFITDMADFPRPAP
jgi:competence protein ComEC